MATTFFARCSVFPGYNEDTAKYAEKHWRVRLSAYSEEGMKQPGLHITNVLAITVRDYPEIMAEVEQSGYFRNGRAIWQVNRISEQGITFYLVNHGGKSEDGSHDLWEEVFIFIPMGNVIAIHNVSQQFFINESLSSMGRKENPASEG